jgi:hypothetical protein
MFSGSLFGETAPPSSSLVSAPNPPPQPPSFSAPPDNSLSKFDELDERLAMLEQSLKHCFATKEGAAVESSNALRADASVLHSRLPPVRQNSIHLARRVQALSLSAQTAGTLAGPQQLRPVQDEFFSLRNDLDQSLKNIASLSRSLTAKLSKTSCQLDSVRPIPNAQQSAQGELRELQTQNGRNLHIVQSVQQKLWKMLETSSEQLRSEFEKELNETEAFIQTLEDQSNEGVSASSAKAAKIQTEKMDMRTSFDAIAQQVAKSMELRLDSLRKSIQSAETKGLSLIEGLQGELDAELEGVSVDAALVQKRSIVEDIEHDRESAELDRLMTKLDELCESIRSGAQPRIVIQEPEVVDYDTYDVVVNGEKRSVKCHPDGTFELC